MFFFFVCSSSSKMELELKVHFANIFTAPNRPRNKIAMIFWCAMAMWYATLSVEPFNFQPKAGSDFHCTTAAWRGSPSSHPVEWWCTLWATRATSNEPRWPPVRTALSAIFLLPHCIICSLLIDDHSHLIHSSFSPFLPILRKNFFPWASLSRFAMDNYRIVR